MPGFGPAGDAFAGAFGVSSALLVVGGPLALRWQRDRQAFQLFRAALDKGVSWPMPEAPPPWLVSLRQGLTTLTLGLGLVLAGCVGFYVTRNLEPPAVSSASEPSPLAAPSPPPPGRNAPTPPEPQRPPPPNPALEEWHRLQTINSFGLLAAATGFVLALVGGVRVAFARVERAYFSVNKPNGHV